jgi:hypothetical protein
MAIDAVAKQVSIRFIAVTPVESAIVIGFSGVHFDMRRIMPNLPRS